MAPTIPQKTGSFGSGPIDHLHPKLTGLKYFTASLDFDAVLRLKAAVDEAAATMNRHNRAKREGRAAGMWLAFYPDTMRFTVGPTKLPTKRNERPATEAS